MGKDNGYIGQVQKKFLEPKEYYITEEGERLEAAVLARLTDNNDTKTKTDSKQAKNTKAPTNQREDSGSNKMLEIPDIDKLEKKTEERMLIQKNNYIVFGVPFVRFG